MQAYRISLSQPRVRWLALAVLTVLFLPGCSDRTADLQQQITSLHNELDRARAETRAAQEQLAEATSAASSKGSSASGSDTDGGAVARNYEEAARVFRTTLESELPDVQMGNFTLYKPEVEKFPFRSEFSMEVRLRGKPLQIDRIPVKAGLDGNWMFPTVSEVGALIERLKNAPPSGLANAGPPQEASRSFNSTPTPSAGQPAVGVTAPAMSDQTVVVQWGDAPVVQTPANPQTASPVRGASSPAADPMPVVPRGSAEPTKVMPVSRDVQIKF